MVEKGKFAEVHRKVSPQFWPEKDVELQRDYTDKSGKGRKFTPNNPPTLEYGGVKQQNVNKKKGDSK